MTKNNNKPQIRFKGFTNAWEQRKLGDIGSARSGVGFPDAEQGGIEGIPFFKVSDMNNVGNENELVSANNYVSDVQIKRKRWNVITDVPAIFFAKVGAAVMLNRKRLVRFPFLLDNNTMAYIFDKKTWDCDFGNTLFETIDLTKLTQTGALPSYNASDVEDIEIYLPNIEEQKAIGAFFLQLDNLITLHQRKLEKLKTIKKFCLEKFFPKNGSNFPEIRFKGFNNAWEQRKLSEIASMHARIGWQNLRTSEFLDYGKYMLITGTDFEDGRINFSTCHYVEKERYDQDKHIQIKNGSILITKDGTLGKVAYVQGLTMPATLNAGVFNVEIKDDSTVDKLYLFQYLKAPFLMKYVGQKATGGTIKHLNQNILVDFPVALPSKKEQVKIGEYFTNLDNLITLHQRKLEKLQKIKKFCLEKMFV